MTRTSSYYAAMQDIPFLHVRGLYSARKAIDISPRRLIQPEGCPCSIRDTLAIRTPGAPARATHTRCGIRRSTGSRSIDAARQDIAFLCVRSIIGQDHIVGNCAREFDATPQKLAVLLTAVEVSPKMDGAGIVTMSVQFANTHPFISDCRTMIDRCRLISAQQFADQKFDLPEGGRWSELIAGEIVAQQPPDPIHGNVVLNLSKALAVHLQQEQTAGYACFELGLVVKRNPDTVRCPPLSFFSGGPMFAETDNVVTETQPALVVEIASTPDRRRDMRHRVESYLQWGVDMIWVADTEDRQLHVFRADQEATQLKAEETLTGGPVLAGFEVPVARLFADPAWWK